MPARRVGGGGRLWGQARLSFLWRHRHALARLWRRRRSVGVPTWSPSRGSNPLTAFPSCSVSAAGFPPRAARPPCRRPPAATSCAWQVQLPTRPPALTVVPKTDHRPRGDAWGMPPPPPPRTAPTAATAATAAALHRHVQDIVAVSGAVPHLLGGRA